MGSRVTVFPVPVTREASSEEPDPARMDAEIQRLRAENSVLRARLGAVEAIALEREGTIEDLRHALQMLPSAWAEKLVSKVVAAPEEPSPPEPQPPPAPASDPDVNSDQAEAFFAEIAALRVRLERKRLEAEQEILEQERKRLLADIEWTRRWQRSRGFRTTDG
ncbi:MAG TPA: hypothetical protein VGR13_06090 [Actinomycetota bacterium]|nr:hypothetical protein [Actinomycetota bacterium]